MMLLDISEPEELEVQEAFGIDLGTTYSLIAKVDNNGEVVVFTDSEGRYLVPSVVEYRNDGDVRVGYDSRHSSALHSVKKLLGKDESSGNELFCDLPVTYSDTGRIILSVPGREVGVSPIEVSARILEYLKMLVKNSTGEEVRRAVITVPAYFDEAARKATRDAARMVGIEVLRVLSEPTASALAYNIERSTDTTKVCLVYDIGGGTFDVSIVRQYEGVLQVVATGGDTNLGGDDIDRGLAELVLQKYKPKGDAVITMDLLLSARNVKESISRGERRSNYEFIIEGKSFACRISDPEFSNIVSGIIAKTITIVKSTICDAGIDVDDVAEVILVGGSSMLPQVAVVLEEMFPGKVRNDINPERAVVMGAALQAYYLSNRNAVKGSKVLIDVVPLSLSLEVMGGVVDIIIQRNTPVPVVVSKEFTTYVDGQTSISIHICQGEREIASENRSLAKFDLRVPPLPAGEVRIEVEFRVDMDGLLTVSARDKLSGVEKYVEIDAIRGVSQSEVERCVLDSVKNFDMDVIAKELSFVKAECERILSVMKDISARNRLSKAELKFIREVTDEAKIYMHSYDGDKVRNFVNKLAIKLTELEKKVDDIPRGVKN